MDMHTADMQLGAWYDPFTTAYNYWTGGSAPVTTQASPDKYQAALRSPLGLAARQALDKYFIITPRSGGYSLETTKNDIIYTFLIQYDIGKTWGKRITPEEVAADIAMELAVQGGGGAGSRRTAIVGVDFSLPATTIEPPKVGPTGPIAPWISQPDSIGPWTPQSFLKPALPPSGSSTGFPGKEPPASAADGKPSSIVPTLAVIGVLGLGVLLIGKAIKK